MAMFGFLSDAAYADEAAFPLASGRFKAALRRRPRCRAGPIAEVYLSYLRIGVRRRSRGKEIQIGSFPRQ